MGKELNQITETIIGAAMAVHRALGPGLLESAYEACLVHELAQRGVKVERQKAMPVKYAGGNLDCGYRLDLLVEGCVPVELKAVDRIERIHEVQLLFVPQAVGVRGQVADQFQGAGFEGWDSPRR